MYIRSAQVPKHPTYGTRFSQAVCYERDGLRGVQMARGNAEVLGPCVDLYGRSVQGKAASSL